MAFRRLTDYEYLALDVDVKSTTGINTGARCHVTDTGAEFIFDGSVWVEITVTILADVWDSALNAVRVTTQRRMVTATLTAVAASNYTAGDVISNDADDTEGDPITFADCGLKVGDSVLLCGIVAICNAPLVVARLRLHFFNVVPAAAAVEMDDNAAFAITTPTGYLGSVILPAFAKPATAAGGAIATAEDDTVRKLLKCAAASKNLYVVPELLDAETNEVAGMTIQFDLYFE